MNSIKREGTTCEINDISADWKWSDTFTEPEFASGICVNYIIMVPAAANDVFVLRNGGATEDYPMCVYVKLANVYDQRPRDFFGTKIKLCLDYGSGTYTSGAKLIVQLKQTL